MLFARVMGVVSPCIFLVSSIMWGLATGHLVTAVLRGRVGRCGGVPVVSSVA